METIIKTIYLYAHLKKMLRKHCCFFCFDHVAASQFYLSTTTAFKFELFLVIYSKDNKTSQVVDYTNSVRELKE